jgi:aldose 1-epimerase
MLPAEGMMDFRALRRIGDGFSEPCRQMDLVGGYDHCYVLRGGDGPAAQAYCPGTGILLSVSTTQPGLQFYSGNYLDQISTPGKNCAKYTRRRGFALETQHYPCSPNFPEFPTTVLRAGTVYREHTTLAIHTK